MSGTAQPLWAVWSRQTRNLQAEFDSREEAEAFADTDPDLVVVEDEAGE